MIYDISAKIENGKIIYSPKYRRGKSKGYALQLKERVDQLNEKRVKVKAKDKAKDSPIQLKLFY